LRHHFKAPSFPEQRTETTRDEDTIASNAQPPEVEQEPTRKQPTDTLSLKRKELDESDSSLDITPQDNSNSKSSVDPSSLHPFNNHWRPKYRPGSMYVTAVEIPIYRGPSAKYPVGQSSDGPSSSDSRLRNRSGSSGKAVVRHDSKRRSLVRIRSDSQAMQGSDCAPLAITMLNVDNSYAQDGFEGQDSQVKRGSNSPGTSLDRNEDEGVTISLSDRGIVLHPFQSVHSGPSSPISPIEHASPGMNGGH
jgi:hypothetical protein